MCIRDSDYFERNPVAVPDAVTLHIVPVANPDGLARVAPGWTTGPIPTCLLYTSRCV